MKLKSLKDQVLVITGASSGVGLATARMAVKRGARVVLAARNREALDRIAAELNTSTDAAPDSPRAIAVTTDVTRPADVQALADKAHEVFGGFDTWINSAAVTIYGSLLDITPEDHRQLFEINYWGLVHGSLKALETIGTRGGVLINIGSILSDRAIPDQGAYSATKFAVKGFTEALRMEVEQRELPVSVSLINPSALDTPYRDHARNYFAVEPRNPPPVYTARTVARAILHCAEHPHREVIVGGGGRAIVALGRMFPRITDRIMESTMSRIQRSGKPVATENYGRSSLYGPTEDGHEHSSYPYRPMRTSAYTQAALHPLATTAMLIGAGLAMRSAWRAMRSPEPIQVPRSEYYGPVRATRRPDIATAEPLSGQSH